MKEATLQYCFSVLEAQFLNTIDAARTHREYTRQKAYFDGILNTLEAVLTEAYTKDLDKDTARRIDMYRRKRK